MPHHSVTVILPTYQEFESLPSLIQSLEEIRSQALSELQLIIVDDNSKDGTEGLIESLQLPWVELIVRKEDRGLSSAVLCGLDAARSEYCIVMDADGSHPATAIPSMVEALVQGADFVVGSRYIGGGTTEDGWGVLRWLNSKIATIMARPFTKVLDPMSGFLAFRHSTFRNARELNPVGYKIGLELIVKCGCNNVTEVPIHFRTRQLGQSKLTFSVQWEYLQHVIRLLRFTHPKLVSFFTFATVGLSGLGVYVLVSMLTTTMISTSWLAFATAAWVAMSWNFFWDRRIAFWNARKRLFIVQYFTFALVCTFGAVPNIMIALWLDKTQAVPLAALAGGLVGSAIGVVFNFLFSRLLVFQR